MFVVAPDALVKAWREAGARVYEWNTRALSAERAPLAGEALLRLVASFETTPEEIDQLVAIGARAADGAR